MAVLNYAKKKVICEKINKQHSPKHRELRETKDYQLTLFSKNQGRIQLVLRLLTLKFKESRLYEGAKHLCTSCVHQRGGC